MTLMRDPLASLVVLAPLLFVSIVAAKTNDRIQVAPNESARRVDITIDGKPFTSYLWPETQAKPVLFPSPGHRHRHPRPRSTRAPANDRTRTSRGAVVNRGNVNTSTLEHSTAIAREDAPKMEHHSSAHRGCGTNQGELKMDSADPEKSARVR
jgi:hypothetical protein